MGVRNLSLKAADGYALTCESTALWHCNVIPDGYGRVGVDQLVPGYESLELDIPGADDERTLGDVGGGIILWRKKYIVFPGSAPRPPSSPPSRESPPPSPHDDERDDHHNTSPSRSRRRISRLLIRRRRLRPLRLRAKSVSAPLRRWVTDADPERSPSQEYRRLLPSELTT